jgi:hypothetical protein
MIRSWRTLFTVLLIAAPGALDAQCAIDMVEEGIQAYRELELETAAELLNGALDFNGGDYSPCATVNARALTYLAATHLLAQRPDSATRAFERAVINAPRFRPDAVEFPPDVTDLFDRVRQSTPAVATTVPGEVVIGPGGEETLFVQLTASTGHWIEVVVRSPDDEQVRALYRGPVVTGAQGTVVLWDGRRSDGRPVLSGRYDLEILSLDDRSDPMRKVVIPLTVESDARPEPVIDPALDSALLSPPVPETRGDETWKAIARGGAGILAGVIVISMPSLIDGIDGGWVRYPVAGGLGAAGVVGLVQHLRNREPRTLASAGEGDLPPVEAAEPPGPPTIRIRAGYERRIELQGAGVATGSNGRYAPEAR